LFNTSLFSTRKHIYTLYFFLARYISRKGKPAPYFLIFPPGSGSVYWKICSQPPGGNAKVGDAKVGDASWGKEYEKGEEKKKMRDKKEEKEG
jgi:hypothetical protein